MAKNKDDHLNNAREYHRDGEYDQAAREFGRAGRPGKLSEADMGLYIEALSLSADTLKAGDILKMVPSSWRNEPKMHRARAVFAFAQTYYNLSVSEFEKYFVTYKDDIFALSLAMKAACRAHKWEKAIKFANVVLAVKPDNAEALYTAGRSFLALRRDKDAKTCLKSSLRSNPHNADAHAALARIALHSGDSEQARWHVKESFKSDGENYLATETLILLQKERNLFLGLLLTLFWLLFKLPRRIISGLFRLNGWLAALLIVPVFFLWLLSELAFFAMRFDRTLEEQMSVESKSRNAWSLPAILIILVVFSTPKMIRDYSDNAFSKSIAPGQNGFREQNELEEQVYIDQYDRAAVGRTSLEPEVRAALLDFELRKPVNERDPLRTALAVSWLAHDYPPQTAAMMYGYAAKLAAQESNKSNRSNQAYLEFFQKQEAQALAGNPSQRLPEGAYTRLNAKSL